MRIYYKSTSLKGNTGEEFITAFTRLTWIIYVSCFAYQLLFFPDFTNVMMVLFCGLAWAIFVKTMLRPVTLKKFPLSTFLLFGFSSTQFFFPLLFTTLEGKPLTFNLELPEEVFLHSGAAFLVCLLAHAFYRLLSKITYSRSFSLMEKLKFFVPPSELQVWLIGLIGMAAFLYTYFAIAYDERGATGAAGDKVLQALVPFVYAPFFIPFGQLFGNRKVNLKRLAALLIPYAILLIAVSLGRNSRGSFMVGFVSVGFTYFLGLLLGNYKTRIFDPKNILLATLGIGLLIGPVADLATAMVNVRGERDEVPALEMIELTLDAYLDKEAIATRRLQSATRTGEDWDELYLDNVFTARFANLKYNDISLVNASIVREFDPDMLKYSINKLWSTFPQPVLDAIGVDIDKEAIQSLSIGDYLYLAAGGTGTSSGFRTGHFSGTGITAFGWWYLLILGIGMIPVFFLIDKFFQQKNTQTQSAAPLTNQEFYFSFCGILSINKIFTFLPTQSVIEIGEFLIRGWLQMAILYVIVFHITWLAVYFIKGPKISTVQT